VPRAAESVNRVKRSFRSYYELVVITADFMIIVKYNQWGWPWPLVTSHARRSEAPTWQLVRRDVDLISDVLPFGRVWYNRANAVENAIGCAEFCSRAHETVIRVYDEAGNVVESHEHAGEFKEP
jgi:hypothetical protein